MMMLMIAGHLGDDIEERVTPNGQKVATMRVAVNIRKGGKEETVWWKVTFWGDRFIKLYPYLKKGTGILVTGRMQPPQMYTDREGKAQVSLEMVAEMVDFSPFGKSSPQSSNKKQETSDGYSGFSQQGMSNNSSYQTPKEASTNAFGQPHASSSFTKTFGQGIEEMSEVEEDLPF